MPYRRYKLPNLNSLMAFEAVVRKGNFTDAGAELNVTKGAISQRMKALEEELNTPLLKREKKGTSTTEHGATLFSAISQSFSLLRDEIDRIQLSSNPQTVTTQSSIAISTQWLTPKIAEFWNHNRDAQFDQIVADTLISSPNADLIFAYDFLDEYPKSDVTHILTDHIWAVASPDFAERYNIQSVRDLANVPLIHMRADNNRWTTWEHWFDLAGVPASELAGPSVNNHIVALELAQKGLGAVIAWETLTRDLVESGSLVKLTEVEVVSPISLLAIKGSKTKPMADEFLDWVLQQNKV